MALEPADLVERLRAAEEAYRRAQAAYAPVHDRMQELRYQQRRWHRRLQRFQRRARLYHALTTILPPWGWVVIAMTAAGGFSLVATNAAELPALQQLLVATVSTVAGGGLTYGWFSAARHASKDRQQALLELERLAPAIARLEPLYRERGEQLRAAEAELRKLQESQAAEILALLRTPWQQMRGREFEQFLQRVLRVHGYRVELTTASRDQGADLLVITPDGRRIAVEAKGYPSGSSVGNDVVLKTLGGAQFHGCDAAAVITNSRFTRDAETAALRGNCVLIDGERMAAFIAGKIKL